LHLKRNDGTKVPCGSGHFRSVSVSLAAVAPAPDVNGYWFWLTISEGIRMQRLAREPQFDGKS